MSNRFYVYELWNPITDRVFYVGKGTKSKAGYRRLHEHIKDMRYVQSGKLKKTYKYSTIKNIMENGEKPYIKIVFESDNETDAFNEEKRLIALYGRQDTGTGVLTNHTDGGEGSSGYRHSEEHIQRLKEDNAGGKATARAIVAICPKTFEYKLFTSMNNACKIISIPSYGRANIKTASKIKKMIAYGYYWRLKDEFDPNEDFAALNEYREDKSSRSCKPVNQYTLDGTFIKSWKSASEVCQYFHKHISLLNTYIKKGVPWNGFIWKLKEKG